MKDTLVGAVMTTCLQGNWKYHWAGTLVKPGPASLYLVLQKASFSVGIENS